MRAAALLALIAWQGLAPFDFQLAPDRFAFLPFSESLMQYRASNLADMLSTQPPKKPGQNSCPTASIISTDTTR